MEFNGGVIIIGSLLWDNAPIRHKWRTLSLKDISTKTPVKVKIRYGRPSRSRLDTYSMIFSNHPSTQFGQAYIIGFKEILKNARMLESQAFALASAEGLWADKPSLNKSWGTVGLLINPNIDKKDKAGADIIRKRWSEIYQNYSNSFNPSEYRIEKENAVVDHDGFLQIEWTEEMNAYDFLIATPVIPVIKSPLTPKQIAEKMREKGYTEYFDNNVANGIKTFQDSDIEQELNRTQS